MSRMSEFNSKFGRQLRCQGFDTFLHTLITRLCTDEKNRLVSSVFKEEKNSFFRNTIAIENTVPSDFRG